jgi:hypothetical protein
MVREPNVSDEDPRTIEALIADPGSPVGIDAKKTHVLILQKLIAIEKRLERLERRTDS